MSEWNAQLYDQKHDFVAAYGRGLLQFVPIDREQCILDLGCGTGSLTARLVPYAKTVIGLDSSRTMIEKARQQYPAIRFLVGNALALPFADQFDVVFSNAVFHWIYDHAALLRQIHRALKKKGLLVCEFGAQGNIATVDQAFAKACRAAGISYHCKFNFPASGQFSALLQANGFFPEKVYAFDRPTPLKDGENGLVNWMKQFYASELEALPEKKQKDILDRVEAATKASLWNGKEWVVDYRRLRAVARKGE